MASDPTTSPIEPVELTTDALPGRQLNDLLKAAREAPGLAEVRLVGSKALLISRFDDVKGFLSDEANFPGAPMYQVQVEPVIGPTFISMDGDIHNRTRQLAMPAFRSRAVSRFLDNDLVPLAHEIVDRFARRGEADLVAEFTNVLPFWAISRKVGMPLGSEDRQRAVARAMLSYPVTPDAALRAADVVAELANPLIAARRAEPGDDVMSHLLNAEHQGMRLDDAQVLSHIQLLYAVGATTTADAMSNMFGTILKHPDVLDRARREPDLRPRIVHESLRFEPPVANLPRMAAGGGMIGDVRVAPGTLLLASLSGANRDPAVFARPDEFDPDRESHDIMSFGFGSKFCPGSHLARGQLLAALNVVLERLPRLRLVDGEDPSGALLRSVKRLVVAWEP